MSTTARSLAPRWTSLADDLLIQGAGEILNEVYESETFNVEKEDV